MRPFKDFVEAMRAQLDDDAFRATLFLFVGLLVLGTLVYSFLEGWSLLDSLYFSVVTLATVGYGDLHPVTDLGKLFTIMYILTGVGVLVVFASRVVNTMVDRRSEVVHERREQHRGRVTNAPDRTETAGRAAGGPDRPSDATSRRHATATLLRGAVASRVERSSPSCRHARAGPRTPRAAPKEPRLVTDTPRPNPLGLPLDPDATLPSDDPAELPGGDDTGTCHRRPGGLAGRPAREPRRPEPRPAG